MRGGEALFKKKCIGWKSHIILKKGLNEKCQLAVIMKTESSADLNLDSTTEVPLSFQNRI